MIAAGLSGFLGGLDYLVGTVDSICKQCHAGCCLETGNSAADFVFAPTYSSDHEQNWCVGSGVPVGHSH